MGTCKWVVLAAPKKKGLEKSKPDGRLKVQVYSIVQRRKMILCSNEVACQPYSVCTMYRKGCMVVDSTVLYYSCRTGSTVPCTTCVLRTYK